MQRKARMPLFRCLYSKEFFQVQKPALHLFSESKTRQRPASPNHSMTGNNNHDRIGMTSSSDSPRGIRISQYGCYLPISADFSEWNLTQLIPYAVTKIRSGQFKRNRRKIYRTPREIIVKQNNHPTQQRGKLA